MGKIEQQRLRIAISEDMTIYNAMSQKPMLLEAIGRCSELDLDLSQVGEMDTCGLQLLMMARSEAQRLGKTMRLTAHSRAVMELLDLYDMAGYFGDPYAISAHERADGN